MGSETAGARFIIADSPLTDLRQELAGLPAPVVVFNKSHSGSRLVAQLLEAGGIFMGRERNESGDALAMLPVVTAAVEGFYPDYAPLWRDPASGYLRRNVSPAGVASPIQVVEVHFPPGARVAYQTGARRPRRWQQVWVLDGCIELTLGEQVHRLQSGDCLAMRLDRPIGYHNPGARTARYAVVLCSEAGPGR